MRNDSQTGLGRLTKAFKVGCSPRKQSRKKGQKNYPDKRMMSCFDEDELRMLTRANVSRAKSPGK